jgi:hypothetical protein
MNQPFYMTLSMLTGDPAGLRKISKSDSQVTAVVLQRKDLLAQLRAQPSLQLDRPGVYLLWNEDHHSAPQVYIGESESISQRLSDHLSSKQKDFWTWAVAFISESVRLHKAHIQQVEQKLIQRAGEIPGLQLMNASQRKPSLLSDEMMMDIQRYLNDIQLMLPLAGVYCFDDRYTHSPKSQTSALSPALFLKCKGVLAEAYETASGFTVKAGSQVSESTTQSIDQWIVNHRQQLTQQHIINTDKTPWVFTTDYNFQSPSAAAATICGRNTNGREAWKTQDGTTLKQLQATRTGS